MKRKILYTVLIAFLSINSCKATSLNPINVLKVNEQQLIQELKTICERRYTPCVLKKNVFIIKIKAFKDSCHIIVSRLHEEDITRYLTDRKDKLIGTFKYDDRPVLVFGDMVEKLVSVTDEKETLNFLNIQPPKGVKGMGTVFEPMVWRYKYNNGRIQFKEEGTFEILK
jgi:hypothetical protein